MSFARPSLSTVSERPTWLSIETNVLARPSGSSMLSGWVSIGAVTPVLTRRLGVEAATSSLDEVAFAAAGKRIDESMSVLASIWRIVTSLGDNCDRLHHTAD